MKNLIFSIIVFFIFVLGSATCHAFSCDDISDDGVFYVNLMSREFDLKKNSYIMNETLIYTSCEDFDKGDYQRVILRNPGYQEVSHISCVVMDGDNIVKKCTGANIDRYLNAIVINIPKMKKDWRFKMTYIEKVEFPIQDNLWSLNDYYINSTDPIERWKISVYAPSFVDLKFNSRGIEPVITEEKDGKTYLWDLKNIPRVKEEENMPPLHDVLSSVSFSTLNNWIDVEGWFETLFLQAL